MTTDSRRSAEARVRALLGAPASWVPHGQGLAGDSSPNPLQPGPDAAPTSPDEAARGLGWGSAAESDPLERAWVPDAPPVPTRACPRLGLAAPGRAAVLALVALALLGSGVVWWQSRPRPEPAAVTVLAAPESSARSSAPGAPGAPGAAGAVTSAQHGTSAHAVSPSSGAAQGQVAPGQGDQASVAPGELVVDVVGKVRAPGLVRLQQGSRVADAIAAAGGALPGVDPTSVNRARPLVDGEQVAVGVVTAGGSAQVTGRPAGSATSGRQQLVLDLNMATVEALDALPGVGPVMAQRIVDWRSEHGRFTSVDELGDVSGIGPSKLASLRSKVRV